MKQRLKKPVPEIAGTSADVGLGTGSPGSGADAAGEAASVCRQRNYPWLSARCTAKGPQAWQTDITSTLLMLTRAGTVDTQTTMSAIS